MNANKLTISLVIPVFNSQDNLEPLSHKISEALIEGSFEIILINDTSKDNSWGVIQKLAEQNTFIKGINLRKNSGQDNAIMAGLAEAKGEFIVIMDDDLQHSPFDIPRLHQKIDEGFDVVFAKFKRKKQALWKNMGSWFNGLMADILIDKPPHIYLSPFKIIQADVVREILKYKGPYPYIDGLLFMVTSNIGQIENVEHYHRNKGKSNFNFARSLTVFLKLATNFSVFPLRIATTIGFISSIFSFLLAVYYFLEFFFNDKHVEGWASLILVLLFLGGLILISLGIVGEYLGRLFMNSSRPGPYIVKDRLNCGQD